MREEQSGALSSRRNQEGMGLRRSNKVLHRGKLVQQVYILIYTDASLHGWEDLEARRKRIGPGKRLLLCHSFDLQVCLDSNRIKLFCIRTTSYVKLYHIFQERYMFVCVCVCVLTITEPLA